jgi:hypothetical protein
MMLARRPPTITQRGPSALSSAPDISRSHSGDPQKAIKSPVPQALPQSIMKASFAKKGLNSEACLMLLNATMENERTQNQSLVASLVEFHLCKSNVWVSNLIELQTKELEKTKNSLRSKDAQLDELKNLVFVMNENLDSSTKADKEIHEL